MGMPEFQKIINTNSNLFHKDGVWVDFNGEPLVDPLFFDRLDVMHEKGIKTQISTNGFLLTEETCEKMASSKIDYVVVSVATLDEEEYQKIRGNNNLQTVIGNLLYLKQCIDRVGSSTKLQAVAIDTGNEEKFGIFKSFFHSKGINVALHQFTNRAKSINVDLNINYGFQMSNRSACKGLRKNLIILSDYEVTICCADFFGKNSIGNLQEYDYSIERLVENGRFEQLMRQLDQHEFVGACRDCSDWIYYQDNPNVPPYVSVYPVS